MKQNPNQQLTEDMRRMFASMDDEQLREKIEQIGKAIGLPDRQLQRVTGDMGRVRNVIDRADASDIDRLMKVLPKNEAENLKQMMDRKD